MTIESLTLLTALERVGMNWAVQAEIVGPAIQKCRGLETEVGIRVFDVYESNAGEFMVPTARFGAISRLRDEGAAYLMATPLRSGPLRDIATNLDELLAWADS